MENRSLHPSKFKLSLKHLPPIDPSIAYPTSQVKYEKPNTRVAPKVVKPRHEEDRIKVTELDDVSGKVDSLDKYSCLAQNCKVGDAYFCSTKYIDPNSINSIKRNSERNVGDMISLEYSKNEEGAPTTASAKSQLHEVCAANNWKSPLFECCKEEGPDHLKLFTFKVNFVIESSNTILECFSAPRSKKKTAAEHAAEGALWYLKLLGYFPLHK